MRSTPVLLTLLEAPQWFVRLHTVRAMAKRKYISQAEHIARRLTDSNWSVREAAARTLLVFGRVGVDQLSDHMLKADDRYSQEQIADEMQHAGLIPNLLAQYATEDDSREARVLTLLTEMGKTSYLLNTLSSSTDRDLRLKFLTHFGTSRDPQIRAWVRYVAAREHDETLRSLAARLGGATSGPEGA